MKYRFDEMWLMANGWPASGLLSLFIGIGGAGYTSLALGAVGTAFGLMSEGCIGCEKTYQEIYMNGEFAFFRTIITTNFYADSGYDEIVGDTLTYTMEGRNPASV